MKRILWKSTLAVLLLAAGFLAVTGPSAQEPSKEGVVPKAWLQKRVTWEEAEKENMIDGVPFGAQIEKWMALKKMSKKGDELWLYTSPEDFWRNLAGREGYALVRDGVAIAEIVTIRN